MTQAAPLIRADACRPPASLSESEVRELVHGMTANRTKQDVAAELGISPQYLGDILAGRRSPGEKALRRLGLRRVVLYERVS